MKIINWFKSDINNKYCLPNNYIYNSNPKYFYDNIDTKTIYQPHVYELAYQLAIKTNVKYILDIGAGNGHKLIKFNKEYKIIGIDLGSNIKLLKKNIPNIKAISYNLEKGLPIISSKILKKSIVICSDVLEHLVSPNNLLKSLSKISNKSPYLLISTPDRIKSRESKSNGPPNNISHVREWSINEFYRLLTKYNFNKFIIGHTINTNVHNRKNTTLVISGTQAYPKKFNTNIKILAIIPLFNEIDIIESTIYHLLNQGIDVHIIDNWSTDGSYELIKDISTKYRNLSFEKYPKSNPNKYYDLNKLLKRIEDVVKEKKYDWYIRNDSDEIRYSPWKDVSLKDAISYVNQLGFNAIDYTVIDFKPTKDGFDNKKNPESFFNHFDFGKRPGHFVQIKTWKNTGKKVDIHSSGGHQTIFENRKVFPFKFLLKHYPLRSTKQAKIKIFQNRLPRIPLSAKKRGWHVQYNKFNLNSKYIWNKNELLPFSPTFYNKYLVERLTGIGIQIKNED